MPADIASKPYDPNRPYKHVYITVADGGKKPEPSPRFVYIRKEKAGDTERYIGFLAHPVGGVFQTNDDDAAAYLDNFIAESEYGHKFLKVSHEELGRRMAESAPERVRVNRGPTASRQTEQSEEPEPQESAPRIPQPSRGPRSKKKEPVEA